MSDPNPSTAHRPRVPVALHLAAPDVERIEALCDELVHCSRHALMIACLRRGLEAFVAEPQRVVEYLLDVRGSRRIRRRRDRRADEDTAEGPEQVGMAEES